MPLFVARGENDIRVPISETKQVVAALQRRGVPVELVRLPNEGHGFVRLENKLTVYPAIAAFLDRYVGLGVGCWVSGAGGARTLTPGPSPAQRERGAWKSRFPLPFDGRGRG